MPKTIAPTGKQVAKRHQHLKPQRHCLSISAINKMARMAGLGIAQKAAKEETRAIVDDFLREFAQLLVIFADRRKTIYLKDVTQAAERMGIHIYGLDDSASGPKRSRKALPAAAAGGAPSTGHNAVDA